MFKGFSSKKAGGWGAIMLSLSMSLVGCGAPQSSESVETASPLPQVVATSHLLCDLTRQVAQETVALTCLMPPELDPHIYAATPSDRKAIEQADLVLYVGYGYELELIRLIESSSTPNPKIAVAEAAIPDPILGAGHEHEHEHEHESHAEATEENHAEADTAEAEAPDPHVWHNPTLGIQMVNQIRDQLKQQVPTHADEYDRNAAQLTAELAEIESWMQQQLATVPASSRKLVTTHDSFRYFAEAFGFEVGGTIAGLSTEERPSATHLAELVETVKASEVPAIFAEKTTNSQWIDTLANDAQVSVAEQPLFVEGPGEVDSAVPNYQTMLVTNTCTIANALGGECSIASAPLNPQ